MTDVSEFHAFAHDLRHHIREIVVTSQLSLRQHGATMAPEVRATLEQVIEAGRSCDQLVKAMSVYNESAARPDRRWPISRIARALALETRPLSAAVGGTVDVKELEDVVYAPQSLVIVLKELVDNGLKFRLPDVAPRVEVQFHLSPGSILTFEVMDNGIGIAPEHISHLFQPFRRLHARNAYPGFGLGLALSRKLIVEMGGQIEVLPSDPPGARLTGSLPVFAEA